MGNFIDLTGQLFGYLSVINRGENGPRGETQWVCRCICGNVTVVSSRRLRTGQTKSCGCKKVELFRESRKQINQYELHDDYVIGYTPCGKQFIIDIEDFEKIKDYYWIRFGAGDRCYIMARVKDGKHTFLHRFITNAKDDEVVDHLNHNGCDNRKCNLRAISQNNNMLNLQTRVDNKSGVPGVWWDWARKKWEAYLSYRGKRYHIGRFESFDEADAARKAAEERYFGPYSYDNSVAAVPRIIV